MVGRNGQRSKIITVGDGELFIRVHSGSIEMIHRDVPKGALADRSHPRSAEERNVYLDYDNGVDATARDMPAKKQSLLGFVKSNGIHLSQLTHDGPGSAKKNDRPVVYKPSGRERFMTHKEITSFKEMLESEGRKPGFYDGLSPRAQRNLFEICTEHLGVTLPKPVAQRSFGRSVAR